MVKMPGNIRRLVHDLGEAGFYEIPDGGKGAHRKFAHANYRGAVTLSGQTGDDAKAYQEKQVRQAIEAIEQVKR